MMISKRVLVVLLVVVLGSCNSQQEAKKAQELVDASMAFDIQVDEGTDFSNYVTWTYLPVYNSIQVGTSYYNLQRFGNNVKAALNKEMFNRGYRSVKESPDLLVNLYGSVEDIDEEYIEEHYQGHYSPDYDLVLPDANETGLLLRFGAGRSESLHNLRIPAGGAGDLGRPADDSPVPFEG